MKVVKFGGSSMADAGQYRKVRDILLADPERRVVVVSAAGKRFGNDHKLTDLLYLCYAHVQYGVDCSSIFDMIASRYLDIRDELGLDLALEPELEALKKRIDAKEVTQEELVSRGEYFSAKLMAAYLGFQFVDAADWVMFNMDGTVNREVSYKALRNQVLLGYGAVIPGFYGAMPAGAIHTFSRGGSDITGALAAAALDADVITIETSRSDMELLTAFGDFKYPNDIGPGVYDIHSPRVPAAEEIEHLLRKALQVVPKERLWVNPDCGLKTRGWPETIAALKVMVDVTKKLRAELA